MRSPQRRVGPDRLESVVMIIAGAGELRRERVGALDDLRRRSLLRRAQQPEAAHAEAEPQLPARPGQRNGKNEAGDRRRHPDDQGGRNERRRKQRDQAEHSMRAVAARDAAKRDRSVVPPLRIPAGVPSRHDLRHRPGLDEHHDRRQRGGNDDLDDRRGDERQRAAGAAPRLPVQKRDRRGRGTWARAGQRS